MQLNNGRYQNFITSTALVLGLALSLTNCTKKDNSGATTTSGAATIRVGEVGSMTGSEATFGMSTHNGITLAFKEINDAGGIKGKKLDLVSLDNQGKPEESATAVTRLITQDKVIAILGEVASSRSLAMAPIAQNYKIPMLSPSSTNPKVTEQGDYIFRVCFIDPFQGTVMARFAKENLKAVNVAILRDVKNDYSVGLSDYFKETFIKLGGKVTVDQSYSAGDINFKAQLTAIAAASQKEKIEAIFVPGYYTEVGLIARQAREIGLQMPLLGGDGWDSPKLTEIGGAAMNGSFFSNHYSAEDQAPQVQNFISKYKTAFGSVPDGLAAMGYDAAMVLADAMKRTTGDVTPLALRDALARTSNYPGVTGTITIDANRNAQKPAVVLKIENSAFKYMTTIKPSSAGA